MAPFRPSGRSNRSGRIQTENDPFEGLPVRQWRQTDGTFGLPPPEAAPQDKDCVFPELPMPRDSHLLAPHVQALLREARKPRFAKRSSEVTAQVTAEEEEEPKDRQIHVGWTAKKWSQLPRHIEEPEREYLAKRRKGLSSAYSEAPVIIPQVATRRAKVRKVDDAGNATIYEVIVPENQIVEGEIKDDDVAMIDAPAIAPALAPGTVVEGIGVANAAGQVVANNLLQPAPSQRRKPPLRKGGPGRGKKKVMFQPAPANGTGVAPANAPGDGSVNTGTGTPTSAAQGSEVEGDGGEGDDEDGDEGEDGEEGEDGDEVEEGVDRVQSGTGDNDGTRDEHELVEQSDIRREDTLADQAPIPAATLNEASEVRRPDESGSGEEQVMSSATTDMRDTDMPPPPSTEPVTENSPVSAPVSAPEQAKTQLTIPPPPSRSASSSPDLPLAKSSHSRQNSTTDVKAGQPPIHDIPGLGTLPSLATTSAIPGLAASGANDAAVTGAEAAVVPAPETEVAPTATNDSTVPPELPHEEEEEYEPPAAVES